MPLLKVSHQDYLLDQKMQRLIELAGFDVDSALPPTDRTPQDRAAILAQIAEFDAQLAAMGCDTDYGYTAWMAEGFWEGPDGNKEEE